MSDRYLSEYDVIIVGSGIAGMYAALSIDKNKKVLLISKDKIEISNTDLAQGGVAVTFYDEDYKSHFEDTYKTGNYYNDENHLKIMVEEGSSNINTLIDWGVNFDTDNDGQILFTQEGGHSKRRIIHYKDTTGREIVRGLYEKVKKTDNIILLENTFAADLSVKDGVVNAIKVISGNKLFEIFCKNVVIATGGIGELYDNTTNAKIATGDGIAFAYRAGAKIKDMEFVQFHPTALNVPGHSHFLISEAVRGEGGILRNEAGIAFMENYHELKDLAPRSIVSRAIIEECNKQSNDKVYVDVTHLDSDYVKNRFPNIHKECLKRGIEITEELIPIIPVQHYIMGGVVTDEFGKTNIEGLYSCGETACTGVHGANRMASNSLLEAVVFANRVAVDINSKTIESYEFKETVIVDIDETNSFNENSRKLIREKLQSIMSKDVFIFRSTEGLKDAYAEVNELLNKLPTTIKTVNEYELLNMLTVAKIIIESAIRRKDSLGSHMIDGGN